MLLAVIFIGNYLIDDLLKGIAQPDNRRKVIESDVIRQTKQEYNGKTISDKP